MKIEFANVEQSKKLSELALSAAEELRGLDFNEEGWNRFISSATSSEFEKRLYSSEFRIFCCMESDHMLGYISIKDNEKIDHLFVLSEARNKGVARLLWEAAKKNAMKNGASGKFWVRSSSIAIPVYEKFGFICDGQCQNMGGISFQLMRL